MKKLITITFLFAFTFYVNAQLQLSEDYSFKRDKQYHAIAGSVISGTVFPLVYYKTGDASLAMRAAWMSACTAGFLKEFSDGMQGKEISLSDLTYTTFSGVAVGYLWKGIIKVKEKKQAKRIKELYDISENIHWDLDNEFININ